MVKEQVENTSIITANDIASYFLKRSEPEVGDTISNLKLQKLVYYAQGFHLALFGISFFNEEVVAWEHGPVVVELYQQYKAFGSNALPIPEEDFDVSKFTTDQVDLLEEIREIYGQFSAWKLRNMTHSEEPWLKTDRNCIISKKVMKEFFSTLVK